MAGLQKWSLVNGTWQLDYVLQNGLNLGQQYTVSANGDQGADPNMLVSITDMLSNTTAAGAANEKFTVLMSAPAGRVLRGVSFTPTASSAISTPLIQSAASTSVPALAPREVAFATGQNLTVGTPGEILGPLPTSFSGTTVSIVDSAGKTWSAPLAFVSPSQVTFQVPSGVASRRREDYSDRKRNALPLERHNQCRSAFVIHLQRLGAGGRVRGTGRAERDADNVVGVHNDGCRCFCGESDQPGWLREHNILGTIWHGIWFEQRVECDGHNRGSQRAGPLCRTAGKLSGFGPGESADSGVARRDGEREHPGNSRRRGGEPGADHDSVSRLPLRT